MSLLHLAAFVCKASAQEQPFETPVAFPALTAILSACTVLRGGAEPCTW